MDFQTVIALVPVKKESERLPGKNFRTFAGRPLFHQVISTLQAVDEVSRIIINTDSEEISSACADYSKVIVIVRPENICGHSVTMNTIIAHDLPLIEGTHFLQTHVTNPLVRAETFRDAIDTYFNGEEDSLFSVCPVRKRVYDVAGKALNHDNHKLLPTQELPEVLVENSAVFLFSRESFYANNQSRIGRHPKPYYMNELEGLDIDYEEDLILAELLYQNRHQFKSLI